MGAPTAVVLGFGAGIAIGWAAKEVYQRFVVRRLIWTKVPAIVMEVGDNEKVELNLVTKPRWTTEFAVVSGRLTLSGGSTVFDIDGVQSVTKSGTPKIEVRVNALAVGTWTLHVTGTALDGSEHTPLKIPVEVVEETPSFLNLYNSAASLCQNYWFNSFFGNALINIGKLGRKGKCNHWADWTLLWVIAHNHCRARAIAYVSWKGLIPHNACKVTLSDGRVFYFDPWKYDDPPYKPQGEVEAEEGPPDKDYEIWRKPDSANQNQSSEVEEHG